MFNIVGTCLNRQRDQYTRTESPESELKSMEIYSYFKKLKLVPYFTSQKRLIYYFACVKSICKNETIEILVKM